MIIGLRARPVDSSVLVRVSTDARSVRQTVPLPQDTVTQLETEGKYNLPGRYIRAFATRVGMIHERDSGVRFHIPPGTGLDLFLRRHHEDYAQDRQIDNATPSTVLAH